MKAGAAARYSYGAGLILLLAFLQKSRGQPQRRIPRPEGTVC